MFREEKLYCLENILVCFASMKHQPLWYYCTSLNNTAPLDNTTSTLRPGKLTMAAICVSWVATSRGTSKTTECDNTHPLETLQHKVHVKLQILHITVTIRCTHSVMHSIHAKVQYPLCSYNYVSILLHI